MIASSKPLLGVGLYSPAEAAFLAGVHPSVVRRWIHGDTRGAAVVRAQMPQTKTVTFLDFIQTLAIREVRRQHQISLPKIREAVAIAQKKYDVQYPLAHKHTIFVYGKDLLIARPDMNGEEAVYLLTGKHKHEQMIKKVVELYMEDVSFKPTGEAEKYLIYRHHSVRIIMDPTIRFGQPYLESSTYSADVLHRAVQTEGSAKNAARAYGVSQSDIDAVEIFYAFLTRRAAA